MEDHQLLQKIRDPESKNYGFNLLIRKYQEKVYSIVRKMVIDHDDTNDLVQEIFIKVWNNIGKFREDSQLYTWVYRIAVNEALTFLKKKRKRFFIPIHDYATDLESKLESSHYIAGSEIQKKLQKALLTLPDKQRMVFNLKYFEEMKYEEISAITHTSIGGLKASYHLAVKKIEEFLTNN